MNRSVIVLDADTSYAARLSDSLEQAGIGSCLSSSLHDAVELARQLPHAVCVADVAFEEQALLLQQMRQVGSSGHDVSTILTVREGDVEAAVAAMRAGAVDYIIKPSDPEMLVKRTIPHVRNLDSDSAVISVSETSRHTFNLALRVARTDVSVFLHGESGTGKEIVASFIHAHSQRKNGPFVALNCAAIPEQMLEAMLFGHEKGAFTGAHQRRPGKFELAHGGSILLDEVSEMPLPLQAKLLRVLQEREVEPVGGKCPKPVDVRVIATTNRDLLSCVTEGTFREDLYYRLNVFPLTTEPLRHRTEDILPLAEHFLSKHGGRLSQFEAELSNEASNALLQYSWPGNVRELENVIQRALVMTEGTQLMARHLQLPNSEGPGDSRNNRISSTTVSDEPLSCGPLDDHLRIQEIQIVSKTLEKNAGNRRATAKSLGVSERTLRHKIQKWREQGKDLSRIR